MQVFRKFDYFRKSTSPEAIKSTFLGGIVSIACVVVSNKVFLVFNQLFNSTDSHHFNLERIPNIVDAID